MLEFGFFTDSMVGHRPDSAVFLQRFWSGLLEYWVWSYVGGHCFGCSLRPGTNDYEAEAVYEDTEDTLVSIDSLTVSVKLLIWLLMPIPRIGKAPCSCALAMRRMGVLMQNKTIAIWEIANQYNYKAVEVFNNRSFFIQLNLAHHQSSAMHYAPRTDSLTCRRSRAGDKRPTTMRQRHEDTDNTLVSIDSPTISVKLLIWLLMPIPWIG